MSSLLLPAQGRAGPLEIAIIGAGTAGLAAALLLHRAGHRVALYEKFPAPQPVGAGLLLQPTGLAVLGRLGLADRIRAAGARIDRLRGHTAGGRTVLDLRYAHLAPDLHGIGVQRALLLGTLWDAVREAGIEVRAGAAVTALDQSGPGVRIRCEVPAGPGAAGGAGGGAHADFDLAVVADGTFSQLRRMLAIRHRVAVYPWGAWWTLVPDPDGACGSELRQRYRHASTMLGLMPVGRLPGADDGIPRVTLFWSVRRDREAALRERGLGAWKDEVRAVAPEAAPLLKHITRLDELAFATYADVRMDAWHDRCAVVIGDAAHATSPQLGQGANLALVDAATLADALAATPDVPDALAAYTAARRAHLGYYQWASSALTPLFQSDARLPAVLRDAFMGMLCRMPGLRTPLLATLAGYKAGRLSGRLEGW